MKKKIHCWSTDEDKILAQLVEKRGKSWAVVAKELAKNYGNKKTGRQCRQRWYNKLDPTITTDEWTPKEDDILFEQHRKLGNRWRQIAEKLPGRNDNATKNHFYATIRKCLRRIIKFTKLTKNGTVKVNTLNSETLSNFVLMTLDSDATHNGKMDPEGNGTQNVYDLINFSRKKLRDSKASLTEVQIKKFQRLLGQIFQANQRCEEHEEDDDQIEKPAQKLQSGSRQISEQFYESENDCLAQKPADELKNQNYNECYNSNIKERNLQRPAAQIKYEAKIEQSIPFMPMFYSNEPQYQIFPSHFNSHLVPQINETFINQGPNLKAEESIALEESSLKKNSVETSFNISESQQGSLRSRKGRGRLWAAEMQRINGYNFYRREIEEDEMLEDLAQRDCYSDELPKPSRMTQIIRKMHRMQLQIQKLKIKLQSQYKQKK